jgi:hypothetical protein
MQMLCWLGLAQAGWCAKLCMLMKSIGYMEGLGEEASVVKEFDVSRPPDLSKAVQRLMEQRGDLAVATKQATYVNCFRTRPLGPLTPRRKSRRWGEIPT